MIRKLLKSGFLTTGFGCGNIKNFSDDVVLLVYLNSRFYGSNPVHDFILRVRNFIVSVHEFILPVHNFILHGHHCRRGIKLSSSVELSCASKLIGSHSNFRN
jgi:hypothetical protein